MYVVFGLSISFGDTFLAELQNSALILMCGGRKGGRQQLVSGP